MDPNGSHDDGSNNSNTESRSRAAGGHFRGVRRLWYLGLVFPFMIREFFAFRNTDIRSTMPAVLAFIQDGPPAPVAAASDMLLFGILVTAGDHHILDGWFQRHINLFEKLVVIDGSPVNDNYVRETSQKYPNVQFLKEADLNLTVVTDQTVRAPAMKYFQDGNPEGRWILVCHADEYWTVDPRTIIQARKDKSYDQFIFWLMTASPMESDYLQTVQDWKNRTDYANFDIRQVSKWAAHHKSKIQRILEVRLFQWVGEGMRWGTRHGMVHPEFHPSKAKTLRAASPFVHYKMSDFSASYIPKWKTGPPTTSQDDTSNSSIVAASVSNTTTTSARAAVVTIPTNNPGKLNHKPSALTQVKAGWMGAFLDVSDPKGFLPVHPIENEILAQWKKLFNAKSMDLKDLCQCASATTAENSQRGIPLHEKHCCLLPIDKKYTFPVERTDNAGVIYRQERMTILNVTDHGDDTQK